MLAALHAGCNHGSSLVEWKFKIYRDGNVCRHLADRPAAM